MTHHPTPRPDQRPLHPSKRAALVRRIEIGWQYQALCVKFPDDWFPAPATSQVVAELVEVCRRCPAQRSCLAAALATGEEHGIWGGTTETDRAHGLANLGRGGSVPAVLDQLTSGEQPDEHPDEQDRGAA
jgi:WhiB family transcriptional regulator, redox-sensing transcriptional regulator